MFAKRFLYVRAGMLYLTLTCHLTVATAMAQGNLIGTVSIGGCAYIVSANGDLWSSGYEGQNVCVRQQGPWSLVGNVFASAGQGSGQVVGINSHGEVLTSSGEEYFIIPDASCGFSASLIHNVFAQIPALPSESIVGFGDTDDRDVYAVTNAGRVFRRGISGCDPHEWFHVGSLDLPTSVQRAAWGSVKVRYR